MSPGVDSFGLHYIGLLRGPQQNWLSVARGGELNETRDTSDWHFPQSSTCPSPPLLFIGVGYQNKLLAAKYCLRFWFGGQPRLTQGLPRCPSRLRIRLQCRRYRRWVFDPWVRKILWRREWQPTLVFLPGEFHEQRRLVAYSPWGHKEVHMTEWVTHTQAQHTPQ